MPTSSAYSPLQVISAEVVRTNYGVSNKTKREMPWFILTLRVQYRSLDYKAPNDVWSTYYSASFRFEEAKRLSALELQKGQEVVVRGYIRQGKGYTDANGVDHDSLDIAWPEFDYDEYYQQYGENQPAQEEEEEIDLSAFDL